VVSQEPVYDDYRYLYGAGMRRENSIATPALYDGIAATPGPLTDDANYNVPLFLTQGVTENNTVADGQQQYLDNHSGYERAWLGPWEHVRGNETCASGDSSTGCDSSNVGRRKDGRAGWFDEVMRFYDRFLKDQAPTVSDPPFAVRPTTASVARRRSGHRRTGATTRATCGPAPTPTTRSRRRPGTPATRPRTRACGPSPSRCPTTCTWPARARST
jgi:hypothetical protein